MNTGISFVWANAVNGQPVTYDNRSWYGAKPGSRPEAEMKQTIASKPENDPNHVFNIYTNSPGVYYGGTLLGWATFPWELAGNRLMDGVVMNNIALNHGGTVRTRHVRRRRRRSDRQLHGLQQQRVPDSVHVRAEQPARAQERPASRPVTIRPEVL